MVKSMTGYGKVDVQLNSGILSIEIKTLNGKNADVNLRTNLLPKDKELEIRSRIASALGRGTIDVYLSWEPASGSSDNVQLNNDLANAYLEQISTLTESMNISGTSIEQTLILNSLLRLPNLFESKKNIDIINDENWDLVSEGFNLCIEKVNNYRSLEGKVLYKDIVTRVHKILELYSEIENFESQRVEAVRLRILKAAEELSLKLDPERLEQEMIFYLEKYDINEEKVRLYQHCMYFFDTIDGEAMPGKKLGFIIQEMGREINTTGSKANHAQIQKLVIEMKDELEKIREQSMNVL